MKERGKDDNDFRVSRIREVLLEFDKLEHGETERERERQKQRGWLRLEERNKRGKQWSGLE